MITSPAFFFFLRPFWRAGLSFVTVDDGPTAFSMLRREIFPSKAGVDVNFFCLMSVSRASSTVAARLGFYRRRFVFFGSSFWRPLLGLSRAFGRGDLQLGFLDAAPGTSTGNDLPPFDFFVLPPRAAGRLAQSGNLLPSKRKVGTGGHRQAGMQGRNGRAGWFFFVVVDDCKNEARRCASCRARGSRQISGRDGLDAHAETAAVHARHDFGSEKKSGSGFTPRAPWQCWDGIAEAAPIGIEDARVGEN